MTTFRKAIIVFYMVLVASVFAIPLLDGLGRISIKDGTSWLLAQIVVATAVPVALAAMKTTDFFRDDPNDVSRLKREHAEQMRKAQAESTQAILSLNSQKDTVIANLTDEKEKWRQKAQNPFGALKPPSNPGR